MILSILRHFHAGCAMAGLLANPEFSQAPQSIVENAWLLSDLILMGEQPIGARNMPDTSSWKCDKCGCTDTTPCEGGCAWVAENKCSKCYPPGGTK